MTAHDAVTDEIMDAGLTLTGLGKSVVRVLGALRAVANDASVAPAGSTPSDGGTTTAASVSPTSPSGGTPTAARTYSPPGGRVYQPSTAQFSCVPGPKTPTQQNPPYVIPAALLPEPTDDPDAAIRTVLTDLGVTPLSIFQKQGGFDHLRPIAESFGIAAFHELVGRLRYTHIQLARPVHAYRTDKEACQILRVAGRASLLAPRVLLAIPGHFRELARRAPEAREAHALENLGWLLARSLRDRIAARTKTEWWLPPDPLFVTPFANPLPSFSPELERLILSTNLIDLRLPFNDYESRFAHWNNSLAGRAWRLETGLEASLSGPGLPFYPEIVTLPDESSLSETKTKIKEKRTLISGEWDNCVQSIKSKYPGDKEKQGKVLQAGDECSLPAGLIVPAVLGGIHLIYLFPGVVKQSKNPVSESKRVLAEIKPVVEDIFRTIYQLGWNDLLFESQGGFNFRAQRGTFSKLSEHGFGLALDLNVVENPRGANSIGVMDPRIVALFQAFHFRWGRCFGTPDPHHFEFKI